MKKQILTAIALAGALWVSAQVVEVASVNEVALPYNVTVMVPTISPDGTFVVASDFTSEALRKITLADGAVSTVTENGNGNGVAISADGSQVVFRRNSIDNRHMRHVSLQSVALADGRETQLAAPSRNIAAGVGLNGNCVSYRLGASTKTRSLDGVVAQPAPFVAINRGHLVYTTGGRSVNLDPQGKGSYLWPALSPDGTKIVYYLAGRGCFVCGTDGSNVRSLGLLRAAKWLDNNTVVGMVDTDDGHFTTASHIVAERLDGTRQTLTSPELIAMYPSASADGSRIAFATPEGKLYLINLVK